MRRMKVTPTEYNRKKALFRLTEIVRRWFPPGPTLRPADVADVMEAACKQEMPGFHVHVEVRKIETGAHGPEGRD